MLSGWRSRGGRNRGKLKIQQSLHHLNSALTESCNHANTVEPWKVNNASSGMKKTKANAKPRGRRARVNHTNNHDTTTKATKKIGSSAVKMNDCAWHILSAVAFNVAVSEDVTTLWCITRVSGCLIYCFYNIIWTELEQRSLSANTQ